MIKGIIFDLGNTLIRFSGDWDTINRAGAEAMATWYLKKKRIKLDSRALVETFLAEREANRQKAIETQTEILAAQSLQTALEKIDAPTSAKIEMVIEAATKICFEPEEAVWQPYPDAVDTLKDTRYRDQHAWLDVAQVFGQLGDRPGIGHGGAGHDRHVIADGPLQGV